MKNPLNDKEDWMGANDEPLVGFSWKAGTERHTSGVVIWSDIFLLDKPNEKIAIVLLDTQGLFDDKTSPADNSRIFALGTLFSSVQIFNLNDVVQEDQLEYLQIATEYAKFAGEESGDQKPFQNLIFLMRDWTHQQSFDFGLDGGAKYLKTVLEPSNGHKHNKPMREYIRNTFEEITCFLMPHPGMKVTEKNFRGSVGDLAVEFKTQMKDFITWMLSPENLRAKRVLNYEISASVFGEFAKKYLKAFQSSELPQISSIFSATVTQQNENMVAYCVKGYKKYLSEKSKITDPNFEENLPKIHETAKNLALKAFNKANLMGKKDHSNEYKAKLLATIDKEFIEFNVTTQKSRNEYVKGLQNSGQEKEKLKLEAANTLAAEKAEHERVQQMLEDEIKRGQQELKNEEIRRKAESEKIQKDLYNQKLRELKEAKEKCEERIKALTNENKNTLAAIKKSEEEARNARDKIEKEKLEAEKKFMQQLDNEKKNFMKDMKKSKEDSESSMKLAEQQFQNKLDNLQLSLRLQTLKHKAELLKAQRLYSS